LGEGKLAARALTRDDNALGQFQSPERAYLEIAGAGHLSSIFVIELTRTMSGLAEPLVGSVAAFVLREFD
jgi:hypothetical protein